MPQKASTTWSGGSIKLDTADKKQLIAHPQQQHNLSLAPNRNVLLTAPPNRGKSSLCLQILGRSAPFHSIYVLHGTPGTQEYGVVDHKVLHECPPPSFWKEASEAAKKEGLPLAVVIDDYCIDQGTKAERKNIELLMRTCASHMGILRLWR